MTAPAPSDDSDPDDDSAASADLVAVPGGGTGAGSPGAEPVCDGEGKRERVPWWRQRRRLFYVAVVVALIGSLWGGWVWWYRADFPMPPAVVRLGVKIGGEAVDEWIRHRRWDLQTWRRDRETFRLKLVGTAWMNQETGAKLYFGRDGCLWFGTDRNCPFDRRIVINDPASIAENTKAVGMLDGARYEFRPRTRNPDFIFLWVTSDESNLILPESPWNGLLICDSDRNQISILLAPKVESSILQPHTGTFTRLPDPD